MENLLEARLSPVFSASKSDRLRARRSHIA